MTGRLITIAAAILLGSSCAQAQIGGMTTSVPTAGMGMTSPLGLGSSGTAVAPTGIPLGAAPLATPGMGSGASNGVTFSTACSSSGTAAVTTSSSTGPFDNSAVGIMPGATAPGSAAPIATTCGPTSATGSIMSLPPSAATPVQLGVPAIPLSSTELSNPGLSPAPCPATGNLSSTSSGGC
jgi:hypothetical protein